MLTHATLSWQNTQHSYSALWASVQIRKIVGGAYAGNAGNVFFATDFKGDACRGHYSAVAGKTHAQPATFRIW